MPLMDDDLDYEYHLRHYRHLFAITASSRGDDALAADHNAQYDHALSVFNPLRDWFTNAVQIAGRLKDDDARYYMQYGAGRRLGMMFYAYGEIIHTADPKRTDPLTHDEQQTLSRDINVLYMHTRGVLDNFAWCLLFENHPDRAKKINRQHVDLFGERFRKACPSAASIAQEIDMHAAWNKDMKARRDPVAHRIPLYIPPSALTKDEFAEYERLGQQTIDRAVRNDFDGSDQVSTEMDRIGRFVPYFLHHPEEPLIPIYPTVPTDMAHVIKIGNIIERALLSG